MIRLAVTFMCAVAITAGCGGGGNGAAGATQAATSFHDAIATGDGATACALLTEQARHEVEKSSSSPCDQGVFDADLPDAGSSREADVYGTEALVAFDGDTVFATHQDDGWRVAAAGCEPQTAEPYDCLVEG